MTPPSFLIADCDPQRRRRVADALAAHGPVYSCAGGAQALALFRAHRPAVVLASVVLSELGGIELLAHLRWCAGPVPCLDTPRVLLILDHGIEPGPRANAWSAGCIDPATSPAAIAGRALALLQQRIAA